MKTSRADKKFLIGISLMGAAFIKVLVTFLLGYKPEMISTSLVTIFFIVGFFLLLTWKKSRID